MEKIKELITKHKTAFIVILAILIMGIIGSQLETTDGTSNGTANEKAVVATDLDELCKMYANNENFLQTYKDTYFVFEVASYFNDNPAYNYSDTFKSNIQYKNGSTKYQVNCSFADYNQTANIEKGSIITIKGRLYSTASYAIYLKDCTIINVASAPVSTTTAISTTVISTTASTTSSTTKSTQPVQATPTVTYVYIAASGSGTKYHRNPDCSGMDNPIKIEKENAISAGYTACGRCG